ncbi:MAG: helix-turn-helix domain-containing protein [Bacteroidales bacterium]|nr:helix-turn-helix domain-containing protein [Bacteroidales bacterium]
MKFNIDKLKAIAKPLPEESRAELEYRDENREMLALSEKLALKIRYLLRIKGLTQADLAERMNVSTTQISKILSGKENLQLKTIAKINIALDVALINCDIVDHEGPFYSVKEKYTYRIPSIALLVSPASEQLVASKNTTFDLRKYSNNPITLFS